MGAGSPTNLADALAVLKQFKLDIAQLPTSAANGHRQQEAMREAAERPWHLLDDNDGASLVDRESVGTEGENNESSRR